MNKDMENKYEIFGRIWGMFNKVRKTGYTDSGWKACVEEADEIGGNADAFIQDLICVVVSEAERQSKMDDLKKRRAAYEISGSAFRAAWPLYKNLMECKAGKEFSEEGIRYLGDFLGQYQDRTFPSKLGNVIYREACRVKSGNGGLIPDLLVFYNKYAGRITDNNRVAAYEDAELLLNARPEYTLHIMGMLNDLQKRAASDKVA